jgi:hypothetical protein
VRRFCLLFLAVALLASACGGSSSGTGSGDSKLTVITSERTTARAADAKIIELLKTDGAHLGKPRSTRFYLDFPTQAAARAAAREAPRSYSVTLGKSASKNPYIVRLTGTIVVTLDSIGRREVALETIARRHNGVFDGWEASPTP